MVITSSMHQLVEDYILCGHHYIDVVYFRKLSGGEYKTDLNTKILHETHFVIGHQVPVQQSHI